MFQQPPIQTDFLTGGKVSAPWVRWFQEISLALEPGTEVTGSRASGAALQSLLTALDDQGVITNKSVP